MLLPGAHVAGLPVEEMAPAIVTGAAVAVAGIQRTVRLRIGRDARLRRCLRAGAGRSRAPR